MNVSLSLDLLELRTPVPFNIRDPKGVLLLRKGDMIDSDLHRQYLSQHSPMVDEDDLRTWTFRYTAEIDRMVRGNESLSKIAGLTRPMGFEDIESERNNSATEVLPDLHSILTKLLHQTTQSGDFVSRLLDVEQRLTRLLRHKQDDCLFVLVQLLYDRTVSYSATHALMCAVVCKVVAPSLSLTEVEQAALLRAALTMNIGMGRLHDVMARQERMPSDDQKREIHSHPHDGVAWLRSQGVGDALWLQYVADHHESPQGSGYPTGKQEVGVAVQLLHMADVFVARISPRRVRAGLPPALAARDVYLGPDGQPNALGAAFVKALGVYIPGSYVRLVNGEVAVVARRGRRANAPVVFAIVGRQGLPLGEPALRDTADRNYEVKASVPADEVKVRVSAAKLLGRG
jgi:HD-GYP domain-containing protein (c-di-GMP phosphodiesterase class II)